MPAAEAAGTLVRLVRARLVRGVGVGLGVRAARARLCGRGAWRLRRAEAATRRRRARGRERMPAHGQRQTEIGARRVAR
eukprot:6186743-Pleurochrysis_carterae.AAC.3